MDKQREILQALGWRIDRHEYEENGKQLVSFCIRDPSGVRQTLATLDEATLEWKWPNLSDPGVFWPMFEEWIAANDMSFVHELCWGESPCKDPCHHFSIYKQGRHAEPYSQGTGPRGGVAEAGISAWHSALVAMGKIEARDVR